MSNNDSKINKYYIINKEIILKKRCEYYQQNKEIKKAYQRQYYYNHKKKVKEPIHNYSLIYVNDVFYLIF